MRDSWLWLENFDRLLVDLLSWRIGNQSFPVTVTIRPLKRFNRIFRHTFVRLIYLLKFIYLWKPIQLIKLDIGSEERVCIIIKTITWISHFFTRENLEKICIWVTLNHFLNKNWLLSDWFWYIFFYATIRIYKIIELWKY